MYTIDLSFCLSRREAHEAHVFREAVTGRAASRCGGCGLTGEGEIVCWGDSDYGILDAPSGGFSSISIGGDAGCALAGDGVVTCWGKSSPFAGAFEGQAPFRQVAVGYDMLCPLTVEGAVSCWGDDEFGGPWRLRGCSRRSTSVTGSRVGWIHPASSPAGAATTTGRRTPGPSDFRRSPLPAAGCAAWRPRPAGSCAGGTTTS